MTFYFSDRSRFIELSAPVAHFEQIGLTVVPGVYLNKPGNAHGCYLIECKRPVMRAIVISWLRSMGRTRSEQHLDRYTKCWTPVRHCDVRKS